MIDKELKQEFERVGFQVVDYNNSEIHCEYIIGNVNFYVLLDWDTTTYNEDTELYDYEVTPKMGCWYTDEDPFTEHPMEFSEDFTKWITNMVDIAYYQFDFLIDYLQRDEDESYYFFEYGI